MAKSGSQKRRREAEAAQEQAAQNTQAASQPAPPSKKARVEEHRTLFVRSLPASATNENLAEFFSQHFPVKHALVVQDPKTKTPRGYGFVTFTDADDAGQAKAKLNNKVFGGRKLLLDVAETRQRASAKSGAAPAPATARLAEEKRQRDEKVEEDMKPSKLIIRNLPWSIKKNEQLSEIFKKFGKVKFADVPNDKGKLAGFGFVTFRRKQHAEKAIEALNGTEVDGRTIAVDWAVDKSTWTKQQKPESESKSETPKKAKKEKKEKKERDEDSSAKKPVKPSPAAKKSNEDFDEDEDIRNFMSAMEDFDSEEEEEEEDDEEEESEDDDEDGGADLSSGSEAEDSDDDESEGKDKKKQLSTDNSSTLFVRNLPFTTTDETLKAHFAQFGAVRYARIVIDKATQKSSGRGFVCFFNVEDMETCARNAPRSRPAATLSKHSVLQDETVDSDGKYTIEGRVLLVQKAVSKEEAAKYTSESQDARGAQDKDRRRLFLLNEGHIRHDSPLFALLPTSEIQLREQSAKQRKKMIESNPSLHLSLTRLALRNIPRNMTSKDLKALAREAVVGFAKDVKEGKREPLSKEEQARGGQQDKDAEHRRKLKQKGVVLQAKIVFESKDGSKVPEVKGMKGDGDVTGAKSRGYGFIEYSSHRWALMGLRWLNGHAVDNAKSNKASRIVAEFAIENANVVARRKTTEEKFKGQGPPPKKTDKDKNAATGADGKPSLAALGRKGKGGKKGKPAKAEEDDKVKVDGVDKKAAKKADEKLAMRTQIIGRKRMMRKMKSASRRGK